MSVQRKTGEELRELSKAFIAENDTIRRLELKLELVREKTLEIRDAWNNYNDDCQQWAMDEVEAFFKDDTKPLSFRTDIPAKRYRGDWSS